MARRTKRPVGRLPKGRLTPAWRREHRQLCTAAIILKERLFRAGLLITAHKMDVVSTCIGWEVAQQELHTRAIIRCVRKAKRP